MTDKPGVRLWTRLTTAEDEPLTVDTPVGFQKTIESVREHLDWLLNSRRGDSPACPTYGLSDLTAVIAGLPKEERAFCQALEEAIEEHEPRVHRVRVTIDSSQPRAVMRRHFRVEVVLKSRTDERPALVGDVDIDAVFQIT
jgi:type VI secretion system lysozyme-like protein